MNQACCITVIISLIKFISTETVEYEDGNILIFNLNITSENSKKLSRFSNYTTIGFLNSSLPPLTEQNLQHLARTVNFACRDGILEVFEILPRFKEVQFHSCQTTNITIKPDRSYELNALAIVDNNNTELPKNLGLLTKLERLYVAETLIEHVEMDVLSKLVNLKQLYLIDSRIKTISSVSHSLVVMPSLKDLNLSGNKLAMVSLAKWDEPSVEKISVRNNQLQIVMMMPFNFPKLKELDLSNNPLDCFWRRNLKQAMDERKVELWENTICGI
ncbi:plant intracellular Ras-group-related LRR protein 3 [Culex quinquefasciatus]|uniref:plant intracellular Ras-group-related LRR protein 3 n=1 Tax=Culex quinquefasciatus TaxID=7176 RepID=UPI0018E2BA06|nr:plant intracellular Ras-group-related LRR protein 3 [Culex quinquefasciatus]